MHILHMQMKAAAYHYDKYNVRNEIIEMMSAVV